MTYLVNMGTLFCQMCLGACYVTNETIYHVVPLVQYVTVVWWSDRLFVIYFSDILVIILFLRVTSQQIYDCFRLYFVNE